MLFACTVCLTLTLVVIAVRSSVKPHAQVAAQPQIAADLEKVASPERGRGDEAGDVASEVHAVTIRRPAGPPRIELAQSDPQGRSGSVACSTCHSVRQANLENRSPATLDEFHQGMTFDHGKLACYACHNPSDSDSLRLADGTSVEFSDVMTLCAQCHGPQATAFAHGAHGGMTGYWDLKRGPQTKNNCIDCHDPHAPQYPKMIVGFKPKDRFNAPSSETKD